MKTAFTVVMCLVLGMVLGMGFVGGCSKRVSAPPGTTGTPYTEVLDSTDVKDVPQ